MLPAVGTETEPTKQWSWQRWLLLGLAGAALFAAATVIFPRVFGLYWGYAGIKSLFHDELSRSAAESELAGIVGAFFYAFFWVPMLALTLRALVLPNRARRLIPLFVLWIGFYGITPALRMVLGADVCFNQATGEPLKWFVAAPDGTLTFYDSPGFDASGAEKQPVSPQICRIADLQERGIRPKQIWSPAGIEFFDGTSGRAKVWYSIGGDGQVRLFDSEGFDPTSGELLRPVTAEVVVTVNAQDAAAREAERVVAEEEAAKARAEAEVAAESARVAAQEAAERAGADDRERALAELVSVFDPNSYAEGVVILGGLADNQEDVSKAAASAVVEQLAAALEEMGVATDRFRSPVYSSGQFSRLLDGDASALVQVGLGEKMRSAVAIAVSGNCQEANAVTGVVSCIVTATVRVLSPGNGSSVVRKQSVTGAGANAAQAIARAAELLWVRHSELLQGV